MKPSIIAYVSQRVEPRQYWEWYAEQEGFTINWPPANGEARIPSPFRDDGKRPSFSINPETGAWFDHGGQEHNGGNSIVSFHAAAFFDNIEEKETAARDLFSKFVHPVIDDKEVRRYCRRLQETPTHLAYVRSRMLSDELITRCKIGSDGDRITIPVFNEFGMCVNIKRYKPKGTPKMLNYTHKDEQRSYGSPPSLYPLKPLLVASEDEPVILCEGEWDALVLESMGLLAITSTHGCKSWPRQYTNLLRGRTIVVCYDNDEEGEKYGGKVIKDLMPVARQIKRLRVPKKYGKDVSDWVKARPVMRRPDHWQRLIEKATVVVDNPESITAVEALSIPLDQATHAQHAGRRIRVEAMVAGRVNSPYLAPVRFRGYCNKSCDTCPLAESGKEFVERKVDPADPRILEMIDIANSSLVQKLRGMCGMPPRKDSCQAKIQVVEYANIDRVVVTPTLEDRSQEHVRRDAYLLTTGLRPSTSHVFEGTTIPHPSDQVATHFFDSSRPLQGQVETFELTTEVRRRLERFQPRRDSLRSLRNRLAGIATWQAENVTKIWERDDLHTAVDLVFHSAAEFDFNRQYVYRGMLDALVIGDTRCGKGAVAEGLSRFYGLGEVASAENCSFAGLVGGCEQIGSKWMIRWGVFPLNNGRMVIIDEASSMAESDFGRMSRVRSEGVAEINKIETDAARAMVRMLWLSNPRHGVPMSSFAYGVESIPKLVGANEDVARFDFALTVATNEVSPDRINASDIDPGEADLYEREDFYNLIMWAWSRKREDVQFTADATKLILEQATEFGRQYTAAIPLVQAENMRIKLARIAAAVAARVFSTDDGQRLIVDSIHVEYAVQFLTAIYSKPSMAYDQLSATEQSRHAVDGEEIMRIIGQAKGYERGILTYLTGRRDYSPKGMMAFIDGDDHMAEKIISNLTASSMIVFSERFRSYHATQGFSEWLRNRAPKPRPTPPSKSRSPNNSG